MKKRLMAKLMKEVGEITENGDLGDRMMLGLPYSAGGGVINPGVDTFSSPDVTQDMDKFDMNGSIDGGPDAYKNIEDTDSHGLPSDSPTSPELTYSPSIAGSATNINPNIPGESNGSTSTNRDLNPYTNKQAINGIKDKVQPDEVITGIDAELHDMVFKRPDVAKSKVIRNLEKDPEYYSKLKFLNIDDKLDETLKYNTPQEIAIIKIMRDLAEKRNKKR
jgi:hypothetical protein